jgi:hypothetical protein
MLNRRLLLCALSFSLWAVLPEAVVAQDDAEINAARLKGLDFLKSKQMKEGHWEYDDKLDSETHNVGITALCTTALIENGVPHSDPVVRKGYEFVLKNSGNLTNTYDIALTAVLLSRMGDRRDRPRIRSMAARLVSGQLKSGGWTYTCPLADSDILKDTKNLILKDGVGDNSCTQFAVLGLWVASRANINIDTTLNLVAQRFVQNQKSDGGWDYAINEKTGSGPAMTTAGLFCLSVATANRIRSQKAGAAAAAGTTDAKPAAGKPAEGAAAAVEDPPVKSLLEHPVFEKGLKRTAAFVKGIGPGSPKYFLWSVERIGVLLGLEKIGETEWFKQGASALVKSQQPDGSWKEAENTELYCTSFAVLFLRKANLGSDISRLLEGESEKQFQIVGRTPDARFNSLDEALAAVQAGETIRIDGNGPYPLKNLELNKDLTLQAGFGYVPVFKFELGVNRLGIKLNPEKDPLARNAIYVTKGKVTLEGLHLQMDPPALKTKTAWGGVAMLGGELRLLNCTISEATRQGMASVVLAAPGRLVVRNCFLVGGRAGVEVVAQGKQEVLVQNCAIYSTTGIQAIIDPQTKKPADITLDLRQSSVQAEDAFSFPGLTGNLQIKSHGVAYRSNWIGSNFLASASDVKGRSFEGAHNLYDVKDWIGAKGQKNPKVTNAKSWSQLWSGKDKDSFNRTATFVTIRNFGNFNHQLNIQDWQVELPNSAESQLQNADLGVDAFLAGTGAGFNQYRDTIVYKAWREGKLQIDEELAAADKN